jgi:hypothetical protein
MNRYRSIVVSLVTLLLLVPGLLHAQSNDQLGRVDFQNS